uniref:Serine/threonine-protein kinase Nek11 n=1 Tax=Erpetoichthys calabaricus TaxID=27687 RepID=A0A8C4T0W3_ERPCA
MPKFRERLQAKDVCRERPSPTVWTGNLIAKRYKIQKKLGSGSFGMVYLVRDEKARTGEEEKVLKEISVGNLGPNDTVQAHQEAQLLSQLQHPNIVKFYSSFLEQDKFCIITEYCEGRDLDCKVEECKEAGRTFPEAQIIEWFIQLLLGVHYMHTPVLLFKIGMGVSYSTYGHVALFPEGDTAHSTLIVEDPNDWTRPRGHTRNTWQWQIDGWDWTVCLP